jgi:DHA1 family tetracycline resistance protein-like MFS transporter
MGPSQQGQLQGALMSLFGVAGMIAPLVFTEIFAIAIAPDRAVPFPGAPYFLAALLLGASLVTAWLATRESSAAEPARAPSME